MIKSYMEVNNDIMCAISKVEGLSDAQCLDIQLCLEEYEIRCKRRKEYEIRDTRRKEYEIRDTRRKESYFCLSYVYDNIKYVEKFKTKEQRADRFMQLEKKFNKIKSLTYFYEYVDN